VDKVLSGLGYRRRIAISLPSFLLAPTLVAQTDYLCVLTRTLANQCELIVDASELPFDSPTFRSSFVWHPRRQHDPSHVWFRNELKAVLSSV